MEHRNKLLTSLYINVYSNKRKGHETKKNQQALDYVQV